MCGACLTPLLAARGAEHSRDDSGLSMLPSAQVRNNRSTGKPWPDLQVVGQVSLRLASILQCNVASVLQQQAAAVCCLARSSRAAPVSSLGCSSMGRLQLLCLLCNLLKSALCCAERGHDPGWCVPKPSPLASYQLISVNPLMRLMPTAAYSGQHHALRLHHPAQLASSSAYRIEAFSSHSAHFAGYETTGSLLNFAVYCLARSPDKARILEQEVDQHKGAPLRLTHSLTLQLCVSAGVQCEPLPAMRACLSILL